MAGFEGTPEDFAKAHQDVAETKLSMDQNLQQLRGNIEATSAGWAGQAAGLFQQLMERFNEKSIKLNTALEDIGELLKQSGVQYEGKEESTQEALNKLVAEADNSGGLGV